MISVAQQDIPDTLLSWLTGSAVSVLAVGILAFIRGWIVPGAAHQRVLAENAELRAELRRLQHVFEDRVFPAVIHAHQSLSLSAEEREPSR